MVIMRKRKADTKPNQSLPGRDCFWDNPPEMSEDARAVFDVMAKRVPNPEEYGIYPEDIYNVITYCEAQAWINQRPLTMIPDTQEQQYSSGKIRNTINPELLAWLRVARHVTFMQAQLFKRKRNFTPPPPPDEEDSMDDNILTAADFPGSIRDSAIEAERMLRGRDISRTMPFALKIGAKAPGR